MSIENILKKSTWSDARISTLDMTEQKWRLLFKNQLRAVKEKSYYQTRVNTINSSFNFLMPLLILSIGIYQINQGNMTIGMLFSFQSLAASFLGPLNSLSTMLNDFVMADTLLDRIYDVLNIKAKEKNEGVEHAEEKNIEIEGNITIDNVSFKYTDFSACE